MKNIEKVKEKLNEVTEMLSEMSYKSDSVEFDYFLKKKNIEYKKTKKEKNKSEEKKYTIDLIKNNLNIFNGIVVNLHQQLDILNRINNEKEQMFMSVIFRNIKHMVSDKYPNRIFYVLNNEILFEFNQETNVFWCSSYIWEGFGNISYTVVNTYISVGMKKFILNTLNLDVTPKLRSFWTMDEMIDVKYFKEIIKND